jgi:hypothetical protein
MSVGMPDSYSYEPTQIDMTVTIDDLGYLCCHKLEGRGHYNYAVKKTASRTPSRFSAQVDINKEGSDDDDTEKEEKDGEYEVFVQVHTSQSCRYHMYTEGQSRDSVQICLKI